VRSPNGHRRVQAEVDWMSVTPEQVSVVWVYGDNFAKHECDELVLAVDVDQDWRRSGVLEVVLLPRNRTVVLIERHERTRLPADQHHHFVFVGYRTTGITIHAQRAVKL